MNTRMLLLTLFAWFFATALSAAELAENAQWRTAFDAASAAYDKAYELKADERESAFNDVKQQYLTALDLIKKDGPSNDLAVTLNDLGATTSMLDDVAGAKKYYEQAVAAYEKSKNMKIAGLAMSLANLGDAQVKLDDAAGGEKSYKKAMLTQEKDKAAVDDYSEIVDRFAGFYDGQEKYAQALPLWQKSLAIKQKKYGNSDAKVGIAKYEVGMDLLQLEKSRDAEKMLREAMAIMDAANGHEDQYVARTLNGLAIIKAESKDYDTAEKYYQRAIRITLKNLGHESDYYSTVSSNYEAMIDAQSQPPAEKTEE
jgi:tetratricopeptide (TPR) repeat protein